MKNAKTTFNFLKQEFEEYKTKASKTLAAKDRLIATLKENATSPDGSNDASTGDGIGVTSGLSLKSIEIDELKIERDTLKEEVNSRNVTLEMLRAEMMVKCIVSLKLLLENINKKPFSGVLKEHESQSSVEIEMLKDQLHVLQENLDESKQAKDYLEQDLKSLRQQLDFAQEELYKQKTTVNHKIQEKDIEIEKLRSQVHFHSFIVNMTQTSKYIMMRCHFFFLVAFRIIIIIAHHQKSQFDE